MKKVCVVNVIQKTIFVVFLFMIGYIVILQNLVANVVLFSGKRNFLLPNIALLAIALSGFLLLWAAYAKWGRKYKKCVEDHADRMFRYVACAWFLIQIYVCYNAYFYTGWDPGTILLPNAEFLVNGSIENFSNEYFSHYPNNIFLLILFAGIKKLDRLIGILDVSQGIMGILVVQCIISTLTGILLYRAVREWVGILWGILAWFFYLILVGSSGWLMIAYSDSMGLFLPILCFRLYQVMKRKQSKFGWKAAWQDGWKWAVMGLLAYWGYQLKPQALVIVIAICIVEALEWIKNRNFIQFLVSCGGMVLAISLSAVLFGWMVRQTGLKIEAEEKIGISHYIMMGLNSGGGYNTEDVIFSISFDTRDERRKAQWAVIEERLNNYGIAGLVQHVMKKTLLNYGDGVFAWEMEGNFYMDTYEPKNQWVSPYLRNIIEGDGKANRLFETIKQAAWLTVIFFSLALISCRKNVDCRLLVVMLSIIGITLFLLLFEGRARYLYTYVPIFILAGVVGVSRFRLLCSHLNNDKKNGGVLSENFTLL